jgi:hypothetical protein
VKVTIVNKYIIFEFKTESTHIFVTLVPVVNDGVQSLLSLMKLSMSLYRATG